MKSLSFVLTLFLLAGVASAGEMTEIDLLRSDIKEQRKTIVAEVLNFTPSEAESFWPIYDEFELEMDRLHTSRRELTQEYLAVFDHLSDEIAGAIVMQFFGQEKQELELRKKYFKKIEKAISSAKATQFIQIESQIDLYLKVQTASRLPLIR